jgi:hypothetical protein
MLPLENHRREGRADRRRARGAGRGRVAKEEGADRQHDGQRHECQRRRADQPPEKSVRTSTAQGVALARHGFQFGCQGL